MGRGPSEPCLRQPSGANRRSSTQDWPIQRARVLQFIKLRWVYSASSLLSLGLVVSLIYSAAPSVLVEAASQGFRGIFVRVT